MKKRNSKGGTAEAGPPKSERDERDERRKALAAVASRFGSWRPARQVLVRVQAVPTIFPQFDHATRVGGLPLQRFALVHGPSSHGKTSFANGLGLSFLQRGHFFALVDAERTTPITWLERQMSDHADNPAFVAKRPSTYEETVDAVREFLTTIGNARAKGQIPKETSGLVVVDSMRKLVPRNILARLLKEGSDSAKGSIDGMGGRAAQIKAALNAAWLDELIGLLADTNCAMVAIARESEDVDADANARKYGTNYKVQGGKALTYESSLAMRVTRSWVRDGNGEDTAVVGERHQVRIWKTKVEGKDDKHIDCHFHTSNGTIASEGFDRARDLVELGVELGVVKHDGKSTWLSWSGVRWQGQNVAVKKLSADPAQLALLEEQVRAAMAKEREE